MENLSLHILDIIQNSITARALNVGVEMQISSTGNLTLLISDDGIGMNKDQLEKVKNPFFTSRTTRKIGLGVSLLTQTAEQAGGCVSLESTPGIGTVLKAVFRTGHPDCPPLGDLPECAWMLMASNPELHLAFRLVGPEGDTLDWDSNEIHQALGGMPLTKELIRVNIIEWFTADFDKFKQNLESL